MTFEWVKNRGGKVNTGSDSGFIFRYMALYIGEMELLREAGFHPLEERCDFKWRKHSRWMTKLEPLKLEN